MGYKLVIPQYTRTIFYLLPTSSALPWTWVITKILYSSWGIAITYIAIYNIIIYIHTHMYIYSLSFHIVIIICDRICEKGLPHT